MIYEDEVEHTDEETPPGSLHLLDGYEYHPTRLHVIDYNPDSLLEKDIEEVSEVADRIRAESVTWLDVNGLRAVDKLGAIAETFDFHPLVLEDLLRPFQRPKLEQYENYLFAVTRLFDPQEPTQTEQIGMVLSSHYLITFQERSGDVFDDVRERIRRGRKRIRSGGADYLAYALLDAVVDSYFPLLESIGDRLEELEDQVLEEADPPLMEEIHDRKRTLMVMRRSAWSQREMMGQLQREDLDPVSAETRLFFRDAYDHAIRIIDIIETYREMTASIMDLFHSTLSNRMNEIMKVLTIMATIFIPLTFVAGVYGMNFEYMPELRWKWAYPTVMLVMLAMALGMLYLFRRRNWI